MNFEEFCDFCEDSMIPPYLPIDEIPHSYNNNDTVERKLQVTTVKLLQQQGMNHRIQLLIYAYYIGEVIEQQLNPRSYWSI